MGAKMPQHGPNRASPCRARGSWLMRAAHKFPTSTVSFELTSTAATAPVPCGPSARDKARSPWEYRLRSVVDRLRGIDEGGAEVAKRQDYDWPARSSLADGLRIIALS